MKTIFTKYPKRIIKIRDNWMQSCKASKVVIRSTFDVDLYLDYLNTLKSKNQ